MFEVGNYGIFWRSLLTAGCLQRTFADDSQLKCTCLPLRINIYVGLNTNIWILSFLNIYIS